MKKIHTKMKRKYDLSTNLNPYRFFHPKEKPHRPKSFGSEALARDWAKQKGLNEFTLKKVKHNKRFELVPIKK